MLWRINDLPFESETFMLYHGDSCRHKTKTIQQNSESIFAEIANDENDERVTSAQRRTNYHKNELFST